MPRDVYVFGDSHWRVFFPFLNTGAPGVRHEQDGIATVDTTANELSGATMYGLLNENSRQGARRRILKTLDETGGVENVGLVFGEVDVRYHHMKYLRRDGSLDVPAVWELLARYRRFIDHDLVEPGRVRGKVFVYYGFSYPHGPNTHVQSGVTLGDNHLVVSALNRVMTQLIRDLLPWGSTRIIPIVVPPADIERYVSDDTVHLVPETYRDWIMPALKRGLNG